MWICKALHELQLKCKAVLVAAAGLSRARPPVAVARGIKDGLHQMG